MNILEKFLPRKPRLPASREILETLFIPTVVILVGVGAFGLGRLSAMEGKKEPLVVRQDGQLAAPAAAREGVVPATSGAYVASKSGSKYYLSTCSGAKNIKNENKVYFASAEAAEASGYEPAANCPGLSQ